MSFYTPPLGKCTRCGKYIGSAKTGELEKKETEVGEVFSSQYFCPVCSSSTDWEKLRWSSLEDYVKDIEGVQISDDLKHRVDDDIEYEVWTPEYRE